MVSVAAFVVMLCCPLSELNLSMYRRSIWEGKVNKMKGFGGFAAILMLNLTFRKGAHRFER